MPSRTSLVSLPLIHSTMPCQNDPAPTAAGIRSEPSKRNSALSSCSVSTDSLSIGFATFSMSRPVLALSQSPIFAFYLPSESEDSKPVLGGGEFVAAFDDRPEVQAVQTYLSSDEYANTKAEIGDWISANTGLDVANVANPIDKLSVETLQDESAEFRFDGSDLMPAAVGAGSFWQGMTEWINGAETQEVLDGIEDSWPS